MLVSFFSLYLAQAYERRFPSCDMIPVFEGSDIIDEEHSEDGTEHVVTRRCKLNVDAPYLLKKVIVAHFLGFAWLCLALFDLGFSKVLIVFILF